MHSVTSCTYTVTAVRNISTTHYRTEVLHRFYSRFIITTACTTLLDHFIQQCSVSAVVAKPVLSNTVHHHCRAQRGWRTLLKLRFDQWIEILVCSLQSCKCKIFQYIQKKRKSSGSVLIFFFFSEQVKLFSVYFSFIVLKIRSVAVAAAFFFFSRL